MGISDWEDYYKAFVAPFSKGQIDENTMSLGVPALLNKINTGNLSIGITSILHLSTHNLKLLIIIFQVMVIGALTGKFIYDRIVRKVEEFSIPDFCLIFMIPLLLSGRVWAHHHVSMGFVYTYLFFILLKQKKTLLLTVICFLCLLTSVITKDVIGKNLTDFLIHYSFVTFLMMFIFIIILVYGYPPEIYKPTSKR